VEGESDHLRDDAENENETSPPSRSSDQGHEVVGRSSLGGGECRQRREVWTDGSERWKVIQELGKDQITLGYDR
jgi:hypothetical protein